MHQSMPDLSFFASTEGRLAGGGEAGGGAWGRGCREEESLPSFLNKCQNSTGQSAATQESPEMSHAIQAKYQIRFYKDTPDWPITACTMHSGYPVRPWVRIWNCRNKCQWIWMTQKTVRSCSISKDISVCHDLSLGRRKSPDLSFFRSKEGRLMGRRGRAGRGEGNRVGYRTLLSNTPLLK